MRINRRLNLVIPVERDDGSTIYVHSTPISPEVFEASFMLVSRTFASLYGLGLGPAAGPRVAAMMLKKVGKDLSLEVETQSLITEIRRLSNVIAPTNAGWEIVPLQDALDKKLIDGSDVSEVENAITFFTVVSAMHKKEQLVTVLDDIANLWGAQVVSLSCTEYAGSLKTSNEVENTGETANTSLVPR